MLLKIAHKKSAQGFILLQLCWALVVVVSLVFFHPQQNQLFVTHLGVWLLGFIGLLVSQWRAGKARALHNHYLEQLELASEVFDQSYEGILITDSEARIVDVNAAFERISGYSKQELLGKNPRLLNSGRQSQEVYEAMWQDLAEKGHWQGEIWNRKKNGQVYAVTLTISALYDDGAPRRVRNYLALSADITHIKENESKLERLAHYDALTGLPNRLLLTDRLQQAMKQATAAQGQIAVVYLDLDGFKEVNDLYGHDVGDLFLIDLTQRMKMLVGDQHTLARIGGDEFVLVLTRLTCQSDCEPLLHDLLQMIAEERLIKNCLLQLTASLGVSFYPADHVDAEQLLRHADQAMFVAKQEGKNVYRVFDPLADQFIRTLSAQVKEVEIALSDEQFVLHYQPKINASNQQLIGAEALIRWQHPEKGLLMPGRFLPSIENHPIMLQVGHWVIGTAIHQLACWAEQGIVCPISINLHSAQLQEPGFIDGLKQLFAKYPDVVPASLEIEVLETTAVEDVLKVTRALEEVRRLGVQISIDDFGTGYSSLSYLKHLPVNTLKIDQSFVRNLLNDPDDLAIVQGVISMAAAFKLKVIAEGVETKLHSVKLIELGCVLVQGYGIAKPLPLVDFEKWLAGWNSNPGWLE